jgi:hypothetical protein
MDRPSSAFAWYLVAVCSAAFVGAPGPVYWDSFGYVTQALTGEIGGLGVGRPLFAMSTQVIAAAWQWFGGSIWDLEPALRVSCLLVTACSAPLSRRLALEAGLTSRAAHLTAAFVALSPAFAHTSATVLTDGPATTFVLLCWVVALRAARSGAVRTAALAGLWFGVAVGLREASVFSGITCLCIALAGSRRRLIPLGAVFTTVAAVVVIVPMAWVFATQPGYVDTIRNWLIGLEHDSAMKAWNWSELKLIGYWLLLFGPVSLLTAALSVRYWRLAGPWCMTLVAPAWAQWAVMMTYMGIAYSPRYLMSAFPAALALPGAWLLDRVIGDRFTAPRRVALLLALLIPLVAARVIARTSESTLLEVSEGLVADLATVPPDAVIVTGHACPAIPMIRELATREPRAGLVAPAWTALCPGWGWPKDLTGTLDGHADAGRVVVVDLRADAWHGDEQRRSRDQLREYWLTSGRGRPGRVVAWGDERADRVQ